VEDNAERAALRTRIHNADVDVNYTIYYPLLRPYVSLYPKKEGSMPAESIDGPKGDVDMWKAVEEAMETGTLDRLRNSKEGVVMPGPKVQAKKKAKGKIVRKGDKGEQNSDHEKIVGPMEEDEGSDGGFFDE
jgi:hypothetical protein